jgi:predicted transcriptional regulator
MRETEFDPGVLETAVKRAPALAKLAEGPHHRRELEAALDRSKTTCHRIIRTFDERGLIRRTEQGYELTELGTAVADQVAQFDDRVRTAYRLQPVLSSFESADVSFPLERFTDATVTAVTPTDPNPPRERYLELFRDAQRVRTVDGTSFVTPLHLEKMVRLVRDNDMQTVAILPRSVIANRLEKYPEIHRESIAADADARYRVYDGVPCGLTLYDDDHVGVRAYDRGTGAFTLFADTGDPEAVAWAEDVWAYYDERADPVTAMDELPEWVSDAEARL